MKGLSRIRLRRQSAEPAPQDAPQLTADAVPVPLPPSPPLPAGVAPQDVAAPRPSFRDRGRLRRRLRFLRGVRELGFRDLGGLVFDLHRFGRQADELVRGKLLALEAVDRELRALERVLDDRRDVVELREPGIAACPRCGALHGSDDRFCPHCGVQFGGPLAFGEVSTPAPAPHVPLPGPQASPGPTPVSAALATPGERPSLLTDPATAAPQPVAPAPAEPRPPAPAAAPAGEPDAATAGADRAAEPPAASAVTPPPTADEPAGAASAVTPPPTADEPAGAASAITPPPTAEEPPTTVLPVAEDAPSGMPEAESQEPPRRRTPDELIPPPRAAALGRPARAGHKPQPEPDDEIPSGMRSPDDDPPTTPRRRGRPTGAAAASKPSASRKTAQKAPAPEGEAPAPEGGATPPGNGDPAPPDVTQQPTAAFEAVDEDDRAPDAARGRRR